MLAELDLLCVTLTLAWFEPVQPSASADGLSPRNNTIAPC